MKKRLRLGMAILLASFILSAGIFVAIAPRAVADQDSNVGETLSTQIDIQPEEVRAVLNEPYSQ